MRPISGYNQEYWDAQAHRRSPWGVFWIFVGIVIVLGVIFTLIGLGTSWFGTAVKVVSPENVTQQYGAIYQDYQALQKGAANVCTMRIARDQEKNADNKSQRVSQELALEQLFNRNAADYDARWQNAFQAKYVGPHDVPTTAPTLASLTASVSGCPQQ